MPNRIRLPCAPRALVLGLVGLALGVGGATDQAETTFTSANGWFYLAVPSTWTIEEHVGGTGVAAGVTVAVGRGVGARVDTGWRSGACAPVSTT